MGSQMRFEFSDTTPTGAASPSAPGTPSAESIIGSWTEFYERVLSRLECTKLYFAEQLTWLLFLKLDDERSRLPSPTLRQANPPVIPRQLGWTSIVDKSGEELLRQLRLILDQLQIPASDVADEHRQYTTSLAIFAGADLRDAKHISEVTSLIKDEVNKRDWSRCRDVLGQAYEQLLWWCAQDIDGNRDAGQVLTPRALLDAVAEVLQITYDDVVFDPAAGTGGSLLAAHRQALAHGGNEPGSGPRPDALIGADIGQTMVRLGTMNVLLNTGRPFRDLSPVTKADAMAVSSTVILRPNGQREPTVVICNPPFRDVDRVPAHRTDISPSRYSPLNFLQHIAMGMPIGARAAIFLPDSVLRGATSEAIFRELIVTCDMHTLLSLPSGTFRNGANRSGVKANILFFTKHAPRPDGQSVSGPLWVYDARACTPEELTNGRVLADFVSCYRPGRHDDRERTSQFDCYSLAELEARGFRLQGLGARADMTPDVQRPPGEIAEDIAHRLAEAQQIFADLAADIPCPPPPPQTREYLNEQP